MLILKTSHVKRAFYGPPAVIMNKKKLHGEVELSRQLCSYSRTSQHFMEPEGSLPCSQEPSTGPYPEPDQSETTPPHHYLPKIYEYFNIIHLRLGLPSGLFPCGFPIYILYAFLFSPIRVTCPANFILLDLIIIIILGEGYKL
jgi:hypothetical protein